MTDVFAAQLLLSAAVGTMFALSGFKKLTRPAVGERLERMFEEDHIPLPQFCRWWVPVWELLGGVLLVFGAAVPQYEYMGTFAALVLGLICVIALATEQVKSVKAKKDPHGLVEWGSALLYLSEVQMGAVLISIIIL